MTDEFEYDVFIIHAGGDGDAADALRAALVANGQRVFLDRAELTAGEPWPTRLRFAMTHTRRFAVMLSARCEGAWYVQAEIARAVSLVRGDARRRIVPIWLDAEGSEPGYGLEHLHGLSAMELGGLEAVADRLVGHDFAGPPAPPPPARAPTRVHELVDAIVECGLSSAAVRPMLMHGLPTRYIASLPVHSRPFDQVWSDVSQLESTRRLIGLDGPPLAVWLHNAAWAAGPRTEASVFERALWSLA